MIVLWIARGSGNGTGNESGSGNGRSENANEMSEKENGTEIEVSSWTVWMLEGVYPSVLAMRRKDQDQVIIPLRRRWGRVGSLRLSRRAGRMGGGMIPWLLLALVGAGVGVDQGWGWWGWLIIGGIRGKGGKGIREMGGRETGNGRGRERKHRGSSMLKHRVVNNIHPLNKLNTPSASVLVSVSVHNHPLNNSAHHLQAPALSLARNSIRMLISLCRRMIPWMWTGLWMRRRGMRWVWVWV